MYLPVVGLSGGWKRKLHSSKNDLEQAWLKAFDLNSLDEPLALLFKKL
ncbi:hypothetical protein ACFOPX_03615 [Helicobacter baculiformis]|uniref:Uncharacterized protein n=1 Tax=Helicobacter baculiformis TaxID=427351 RepID=A0ABV7ZJI7_9HELI|nr:hypothetical protein [Helicobacter baculiformis]